MKKKTIILVESIFFGFDSLPQKRTGLFKNRDNDNIVYGCGRRRNFMDIHRTQCAVEPNLYVYDGGA